MKIYNWILLHLFLLINFFGFSQTLKMTSGINYVRVGDLDVTGNKITVECLVKKTGGVNIVSKHTDPSNVNYLLRIGTFELNAGGTFILMNNPYSGSMSNNVWYHIAGTYDGSYVRYYVNGCLVIQQAASGNLVQNNLLTGIGNRTSDGGEQFFGEIDELRIWNVARTETEIKANMFDLPNPTTQTGLLAYYKFNNNLINLQGNAAHNGSWTGTAQYGTPEPTASDIQILAVNSVTPTDLTCYNAANGQIAVAATGTNLSYSLNGTTWTTSNPITGLSAGNYTVRVRSAEGCILQQTTTISQPEELIVSASNNGSVCIGNSVDISATTSNTGVSYTWTGPASYAGTAATDAVSVAGTYSVTISKNGCSSNASTTNVTINPLPSFSVTPNNVSCYGLSDGSIALSSSMSGLEYSLDNVTWTNTTSFSGLTAGAYTVYARTGAGCTAQENITITEPEELLVTASNSGAVCSGNTVTITAATSNTGITYSWTGPASYTGSADTDDVSAAGTYSVTISKNGCTSVAATTTVSLNALPVVSLVATDVSCYGANDGTVTVTTSMTGLEYSHDNVNWTTNNAISNLPAGTYTLYVRTTDGCAIQENVVITEPEELLVTASNSGSVCEGNTVTVTAATSNTGVTYSWTGPNSFSNTSVSAPVSVSGTYSVIVSKNGCSSAAATTNVVINPLPVFTAALTDVSCYGLSNGAVNLSSSMSGLEYSINNTSWSANTTISNLSAGSYVVYVRTANGCLAQQNISIAEPEELVVTASNGGAVCQGNNVTITASTNNTGVTYSWTGPGAFTSSSASAGVVSGGTYSVTISKNGCTSNPATTNVQFYPLPQISTTVTQISCHNANDGAINVTADIPSTTFVFNPQNVSGSAVSDLSEGVYTVVATSPQGCTSNSSVTIQNPSFFDWNTAIVPTSCFASTGKVVITPTSNANLTVTWTDNNSTGFIRDNLAEGDYQFLVSNGLGCNLTGTVTVPYDNNLNLTNTQGNTTIMEGGSVQININSSPYIPQTAYDWIPNYNISCNNCPNPVVSPAADTVYTVIVKTPNGCTDTLRIPITVEMECGELFIPTIFSPNGDGNNDYFMPYGRCVKKYNLKIYNRWGEVVFNEDNSLTGWDGIHKGKEASSGTYVYRITLSLFSDEVIEKTGNVTLVR